MVDRSRWAPEMAAFTAAAEAEAAKYPPVRVELPLEPHRRINDLLGMRTAVGGPEMAETADRWVAARGPALRGVLANYPVSDSRFDTSSYREFGAGGYGLNRERMAFYWQVYCAHAADRMNPLAAPPRADLTGLPPVMVLLAELDVLRSEGEALVVKLRAAGVDVETKTFAGVVHGFLRATATVTMARDAVAIAGAWMQRVGQG